MLRHARGICSLRRLPGALESTVRPRSADAIGGHHRHHAGRQERAETMTHLKEALQQFVALFKAGPWGHPIVTHHHLHKG